MEISRSDAGVLAWVYIDALIAAAAVRQGR